MKNTAAPQASHRPGRFIDLRKSAVAALAVALLALPAAAPARSATAPAIHLRTIGAGPKCWVLLHPFGASGKLWEKQAARLAGEQNARVISPDLPSHGGSALVKRFDYDEAAILVGAALSPVCPKPQAIVGASSGGIVALKLGARMKVSVVAIGAGASFSAKNVADMASQSRALPASTKSWHDRFADQGKPQTVALQKHLGDLAAIGTKPMFSPQEQQALASNVLLIHGRQDAFFAVENADLLARQITGSLFMTVNGADHLGPLGKPYSHFVWGIINGFVTRANSPQQ